MKKYFKVEQQKMLNLIWFDVFNNTIYQIEIQPQYYWMATVSKVILKQILHLQKYNNCLNTYGCIVFKEFQATGELIFFWQK